MTVSELIAALLDYAPNAEVWMSPELEEDDEEILEVVSDGVDVYLK